MSKQTILKLLAALVVGAVVMAVGAVINPALATLGLLLPLFALGSTFVEDITETTTPAAHKVKDVSSLLTMLRPDVFTLDTILRRLEAARGDEAARQVKVEWEEDASFPRGDTVNGATSAGAAAGSVNVVVDNGGYWRKDDLIYLPDNATAPGAVLYVAGVNTNTLTVYRIDQASSETAFGTVPALADAEALKRLAPAKEEYGNASDARASMPAQLYNYTQIMDAVISASETRLATTNYTERDWDRNRNQILYDFRSSVEFATIFGERSIINDPTTGKQRTTMGGITSFLTSNDLTYTTGSLTEANLITFSRQVFSGNSGSRMRWWFSTPNQTEEIDALLIASGTLQSTRDENVLGVEATRLHTSFGDLMLINHQGLSELGKTNYGLIVDPAYIRRRTLRPMRIKDVQDADQDGRAQQWIEEFTMEVRYEATHAVVRDSATDSFA